MERFLEQPHAPVENRYLGWVSYFHLPELLKLLRPELASELREERLYAGLNKWRTGGDGLPLLDRLLYLNFMTYLPEDLHVKMDRMSMASSLETRSPMLDTALVEFVASLPPDLKINRGRMKYILRLAFRDILPPELLKRKKHGFGVPLGHWFRHRLRGYVEEVLLSPSARLRQYLQQDIVRGLFRQHMQGKRECGYQLWVILNFEMWLRMLEEGKLWMPLQASD